MEITLPKLGETVTEGTIVRWYKHVGDAVGADETLFEVSTDKVDTEIPSPVSGVVTAILVTEGETVPVGTVVALVGEAVPPPVVPTPAAAAPAPTTAALPVAMQAPVAPAPRHAAPTPRRAGPRHRDSPLVRRLLREYGIDASLVRGTGPSGRIRREDVESYLTQRSGSVPHPQTCSTAGRGSLALTMLDVDLGGVERAIAGARASAGARQPNLSPVPFVLRAVVDALAAYPELVPSDGRVHLAVTMAGVDTALIQDADGKRLRALARSMVDSVATPPADAEALAIMSLSFGGPGTRSVSITPGGAPVSDLALAMSAPNRRVVVGDDGHGNETIVIRSVATLALSHRAEHPAAAFLDHVAQIIEHRAWEGELP